MNAPSSPDAMRLSQARIPDDAFARMRRDNLARWPTGAAVDFAQALERHRSLPPHKQLAWVMRRAVAAGRARNPHRQAQAARATRKRRVRAGTRDTKRLRDFGAARQAAQRQMGYITKPGQQGRGKLQAKAEEQ